MGRWKKAQRRPPRAGGQPEERRVIRHARLQRPQPEAPLAGDVAQARQQLRPAAEESCPQLRHTCPETGLDGRALGGLRGALGPALPGYRFRIR